MTALDARPRGRQPGPPPPAPPPAARPASASTSPAPPGAALRIAGSARLTARGWAVVVCCPAAAAGGASLGYPELFAVAAGAFAALLLAAATLLRGLRLAVSRQLAPERVARGEPAVALLRVTNRGRRATRRSSAIDRVGARPVPVELTALGRGMSASNAYRLPTDRRGRLSVGPLLLRTADPLGLVTRVLIYGTETTLLVRPRTAALAPPASGRRASVDGPYSENAPSGTAVFHTLREYVPGDSLRHVHWRTSARSNTLMVRQLVDTALPETLVVLDTRPESYGPAGSARTAAFDIAVDAAATIAAGMAGAGFPAVVLTAGGERMRANGPRAVSDLLDQLAELGMDPDGAAPARQAPAGLGRAVERARRAGSGRGAFALITGPDGDLPGRALAAARAHFERTVVLRAAADRPVPGQARGQRPAVAAGGFTEVTVTDAEAVAAAWARRGHR